MECARGWQSVEMPSLTAARSPRERGMVEVERCGNWMIYALPVKRETELEANLKCLQDCTQTHSVFAKDIKALTKLRATAIRWRPSRAKW